MGYYVTLEFSELKFTDEIGRKYAQKLQDKDELYLDWVFLKDKPIHVDEAYFKWIEDLVIKDLQALRGLGVRGWVEFAGEEHQWFKYVLDEGGVKFFSARVVYDKEPEMIYRLPYGIPSH
jgi:hypothetical protein